MPTNHINGISLYNGILISFTLVPASANFEITDLDAAATFRSDIAGSGRVEGVETMFGGFCLLRYA
jgi:hypothetical protein